MKLARVELEWEDGSIERLCGDAAEEWSRIQSGDRSMASAHGIQYASDLPWEVVREKTHDVPDGLDPVTRKVHENSKAFYALLPELRKTLTVGRRVVMQDCRVVADFATLEEAYKYALERWGPDGGFALCPIEPEYEQCVPSWAPSPLTSDQLEALVKESNK
jgi:hypothetical protein